MDYAKYIGRVGALAVALGVGVAVASTPAIAYAEPSDSSSSSSSDSSSTKPASKSNDSSDSDAKSPSGSAEKSKAEESKDRTDESPDDDAVGHAEDAEKTPPAAGDEAATSGDDDTKVKGSTSRHRPRAAAPTDGSDDVKTSVTAAVGQSNRSTSQKSSSDAVTDTPAKDSAADDSPDVVTTVATTFTARVADESPAPVAPQRQQHTIVNVVSDPVAAVLPPLIGGQGTGSPILPTLVLGVLSAVRNEIERALVRSTSKPASQFTVTQLDPTPNSMSADPNPNVLVIGVDGTNLSRILADPRNENFFALMGDSTTAASSIVGHTTISNPSWSAILTGAWGEQTGVINNVFTPWTYDKWPTVFNQLEEHNSAIETTTIADWNVINAISGAGSTPVDDNVYIAQIDGDTNWSKTDDAVGEATVDAIEDTPDGVPSFIFSYFVGVDENGHMHGGASQQYADAVVNVDENLGDILQAVADWETDHPGEGEWTILVVTDHGHQPQQGFGHGFQTPDETATFVIAKGPGFNDGYVNPDYEIVDTTPTVLTLFGASVPANSDGVSLTTLGPGTAPADLHQALKDMIATNHSPDFVTNVALSLRTIFATIPYYIWTLSNDGTLPIPILGNVLYAATNIPAQLVALLTGVSGASIFPLLPPGPPSWPGQDEAIEPDTTLVACGGTSRSAAAVCDAASLA